MYQKNEEENENVEIFNNYEPFLYKLVGTWAYSPHPKHWREFLDWFNSIDEYKFDPYVPGMLTSDWLHIHNSMGKRHMTWVILKIIVNLENDKKYCKEFFLLQKLEIIVL